MGLALSLIATLFVPQIAPPPQDTQGMRFGRNPILLR